ncbi:type II toxin-antitoxin system RelE/ParE family toxin [Candidatus Daviesbacteria bacterium]|nr:type II toxin-antitoxin system RelE/ParE family toxin [Candidatus Daviesbacteria bacterium]
MDFKVIYYQDSSGKQPVEEFLVELKRVNGPLAAQVSKAIEKIRNRAYHKEPLSKHLESGLWELRVRAGTDILRIIYTFEKGRIIILLHGFTKKDQKTPVGDLELARRRLKEVKEREENQNEQTKR